jgi:hypothetical protein
MAVKCTELPAGCDIPGSYRKVIASTGKRLAVAIKRETPYFGRMTGQNTFERDAGRQLPA